MKICKVKNEKEKSIILKMKKEKNKYKDEIKRLKERLKIKFFCISQFSNIFL